MAEELPGDSNDMFYALVTQHFTEKKVPLDLLVASILLPQQQYPRSLGIPATDAQSLKPPFSFKSMKKEEPILANTKILPDLAEMLRIVDKIIEIVKLMIR